MVTATAAAISSNISSGNAPIRSLKRESESERI